MKLKSNALQQTIKFALATTAAGLFVSGSAIAQEEQTEVKVNKNMNNSH